jgi:hypothetical protein
MAQNRTTFLRGDEVASKIREVLRSAGRSLAKLRDAERDPDVLRVLDKIDDERRSILETTLADYEENLPPSALRRVSQYTVEFPEFLLEPPHVAQDATSEAVLSWMLTLIDRLVALFEQQAANGEGESAGEVFEQMAESLRGHARQIARIAGDVFDLGLDGARHAHPSPAASAESRRTGA